MTATTVGIDPGSLSWGWFACDHSRELSWGIYEFKHKWNDRLDALDEVREWLVDWTQPCRFVMELQPAIARHGVLRTEMAFCAIAWMIDIRVLRRRPKGRKKDRQDMAWAYWKLPELKMSKKRAEHIKDAAWLCMVEDSR